MSVKSRLLRVKQADIAWNPQLSARLLPSGAIEEEDSVTALRHLAADLFKMEVHRLGVGTRQHQGRAGIAARAASGLDGESLYPLVPGGERQHELALRGCVNLVMYTLTGNYKSDQVHVRDLLERLAH